MLDNLAKEAMLLAYQKAINVVLRTAVELQYTSELKLVEARLEKLIKDTDDVK